MVWVYCPFVFILTFCSAGRIEGKSEELFPAAVDEEIRSVFGCFFSEESPEVERGSEVPDFSVESLVGS